MNNRWLSFLIVKVQILVSGVAEINHLRSQGVVIYQLKKHPEGYLVTVRKGAVKAYPIVRYHSIYPLLLRFIVPMLGASFFLIMLMRHYTIGYQIEGNFNAEMTQELEALLEPHFRTIGPYKFLRSDLLTIEEQLEEYYNEYVWFEVTQEGSDIIIEIYSVKTEAGADEIKYGDTLYARRSGVIKQIDAKSCRVVVEVNQLVKAGDPLITCYVLQPFTNEMIPIEGVARGTVLAEVWYEASIQFPKQYVEQMLTTRIKRHFVLNIGNFQLEFPTRELPFADYERRITTYDPFFFMNRSLFFLERIHYYEKRDIIKLNEIEAIKNNIHILIKNELTNQSHEGFTIENLEIISIEEIDNEVTLRYHVTILENIAQ